MIALDYARTGASVRRISLYQSVKSTSEDEIVESIVKAVRPQTRVIAVTWVHSSTGLKIPVGRIADALKAVNARRSEEDRALLCVDGVHGFGVENATALGGNDAGRVPFVRASLGASRRLSLSSGTRKGEGRAAHSRAESPVQRGTGQTARHMSLEWTTCARGRGSVGGLSSRRWSSYARRQFPCCASPEIDAYAVQQMPQTASAPVGKGGG